MRRKYSGNCVSPFTAQDFLLNESGVGYNEYPFQVKFYTIDFLTGEKKDMTNSYAH